MKKLIAPIGLLIVFIVYTVCIKYVDVAAIGPEGSSVGFASINGVVATLFGYNSIAYNISKVLGLAGILTVLIFAGLGLVQLITKKSIKKVDREIYVLGAFYILVGILYVAFNKIVINYRPVIMDPEEGLEASYPSSHTMLAVCVFGSAIIMVNKYIKNNTLLIITQIAMMAMLAGTVVARLVSGVHWFTDIIGGIILSMTLLTFFISVLTCVRQNEE